MTSFAEPGKPYSDIVTTSHDTSRRSTDTDLTPRSDALQRWRSGPREESADRAPGRSAG
jgi:hypothetical protein